MPTPLLALGDAPNSNGQGNVTPLQDVGAEPLQDQLTLYRII